MTRHRQDRPRVGEHADEPGELTDLGQVVELPAHSLLVVVEPPRRSPLHERGHPGPREGARHRREQRVVRGVDVVEDRARQGAVPLELPEEPGEPRGLTLVAHGVGARVVPDLREQPRRHVADRSEVQLQHRLVGEGELRGERDDLEHDRVTLVGRRCAAEPRPANRGIGCGRVAGKVGEARRGRGRSPVRRARRTARATVSARRAARRGRRPRSPSPSPGDRPMRSRRAGRRAAGERRRGGTWGSSRPGSRRRCRCAARSSPGSSVVATARTSKCASSACADQRGSWRFASSQISRAVEGSSGRSIPNTRRSSRCDQTYSGLRISRGSGGGPGREPLPRIGVARDEPLVEPGETHGPPLVVVVLEPEVGERLVDAVAGDVRGRQVVVEIDDRSVLGDLVEEHAGRLTRQQEVVVQETVRSFRWSSR